MAMKLVAAAASMLAVTAASSAAHAEERAASFDWGKAIVDLDRYARTGAEQPLAQPGINVRGARVERPSLVNEPYVQNPGNAWFGVAPKVALVARDWASTFKIAGDRLSLVDAMRLSASTRMIVTRVRLNSARVTPFMQLGLGQWRVDRQIMPLTPRSIEVAGQFGGGIEVRLGERWQLACETTVTAIYREVREPNNLPETRLWSTMLAARAQF